MCSSRKYPSPPWRKIVLRPPSPQDFLSPKRLFRPPHPPGISLDVALRASYPLEIPVLIGLLYILNFTHKPRRIPLVFCL